MLNKIGGDMAACSATSLVMTSYVKNRMCALQQMNYRTNEECKYKKYALL
jgi:hypothetical protein